MCLFSLSLSRLEEIRVVYNMYYLHFIPICQAIRARRSNKLRLLTGNMRLPRRRHRCIPESVRVFLFLFFFLSLSCSACGVAAKERKPFCRDKDRNSTEARRYKKLPTRGMVTRRLVPELLKRGRPPSPPASGLNSPPGDNIAPGSPETFAPSLKFAIADRTGTSVTSPSFARGPTRNSSAWGEEGPAMC